MICSLIEESSLKTRLCLVSRIILHLLISHLFEYFLVCSEILLVVFALMGKVTRHRHWCSSLLTDLNV